MWTWWQWWYPMFFNGLATHSMALGIEPHWANGSAFFCCSPIRRKKQIGRPVMHQHFRCRLCRRGRAQSTRGAQLYLTQLIKRQAWDVCGLKKMRSDYWILYIFTYRLVRQWWSSRALKVYIKKINISTGFCLSCYNKRGLGPRIRDMEAEWRLRVKTDLIFGESSVSRTGAVGWTERWVKVPKYAPRYDVFGL